VLVQTAEAQHKKTVSSPAKRIWTKESFFEELAQNHPTEVEKARIVYDWIEDRFWGWRRLG